MYNTQETLAVRVLAQILTQQSEKLDKWFSEHMQNIKPFFYNSIDIRRSSHKIAPVDTNLFPAGFNNISPNNLQKAIDLTSAYFLQYYPEVKNILLIGEDHTRNLYYLENLYYLQKIINDAGFNILISNFATSLEGQSKDFTTQSGKNITIEPMIRNGNIITTVSGFKPDFILVNNDFTNGIPEIIANIEQPIIPPPDFGWFQRRKTAHFDSYNNVAASFCNYFSIDPWLITTLFDKCGVVNFSERTNIKCVADKVDNLLIKIRKKYEEYEIKDEPYIFIKSDRGTYGMGIMTVKNADEVYNMNKDNRKKMSVIKGGEENTEVIIQEGVPTIDQVDGNPAEPMIYLIGGKAVDCFFRVNTRKDKFGNLNSSGMQFVNMKKLDINYHPCRVQELVASIAALASALECYAPNYVI